MGGPVVPDTEVCMGNEVSEGNFCLLSIGAFSLKLEPETGDRCYYDGRQTLQLIYISHYLECFHCV